MRASIVRRLGAYVRLHNSSSAVASNMQSLVPRSAGVNIRFPDLEIVRRTVSPIIRRKRNWSMLGNDTLGKWGAKSSGDG